jgi:proteasome lid subunit RPN8/RPN11
MKKEKDIVLIISAEILDECKTCVIKAQPNEACGLIFGEIKELLVEGGFQYQYIAKKFRCIESTRKSTVSFLMDNVEVLNKILQEATEKFNLRLISIFHSHPSGAGAYPSGIDDRNMQFLDNCGNKAFKNQIWTIMNANNFELNGFIYLNNQFLQIHVIILKK